MVELKIVLYFFGLIAFVPNDSQSPESMTAYLVKPPRSACPHEAKIAFEFLQSDCLKHKCNYYSSSGICVCPLDDTDIIFSEEFIKSSHGLKRSPDSRVPAGIVDGKDFSWIPRMASIDGREETKIDSAKVLGLVGARVNFSWDDSENCEFEEREGRVHVFEFVKPSESEENNWPKASKLRQALSDRVKFSGRLKASSSSYRLTLKSRSGGAPMYFDFSCNDKCPDLWIFQSADPNCECEDYGHHFAAYSDLVIDPKGLIPHILKDYWDTVPSRRVQPNGCKKPDDLDLIPKPTKECLLFPDPTKTSYGRPICPMVIIDP